MAGRVGITRTSVSRHRPGPVPPGENQERPRDGERRDDRGGGDPVDEPVVRPEGLQQEPRGAIPDKEEQDDVARPKRTGAPGQHQQDDRADQAGDRLVQEERHEMRVHGGGSPVHRAGPDLGPVCALDRDPPGEVRGRPVELLVEEVAPACHRLHEQQARRGSIRPGQERLPLPAGVGKRGKEPGRDAPVDAEAAVRRQDDRRQVVLVASPLVDDVVRPAADERRERDDDEPVDEQPGVETAPDRLAFDDQVRRREPDRVHDPVPVDLERAKRERDRLGRPVDHRGSVPASRGSVRRRRPWSGPWLRSIPILPTMRAFVVTP